MQRRALLQWLAASPALTLPLALRAAVDPGLTKPTDALDVFDFEKAASLIVPPAHWGYLQSGVDGNVTRDANHSAYAKWKLIPRRFVDVSKIDMSTTVLGTAMSWPIMTSPIGGLRALHVEADIGVARATRVKKQNQIVSTQMSDGLEDIIEARGAPVWFQLYTTNRIEATRTMVQRAQRAGCTVVCVTVDLPAGRNTVTASRLRRSDTRVCGNCHVTDANGNPRQNISIKPMFTGLDTNGLGLTSPSLSWDFIKRLKDMTTMKVVIKGIEAREDAELAVENGADGILVSNHGGRAGIRSRHDRIAARCGAGSRGPHSGDGRWRHSAWHRCVQGAGIGRQRRWHWSSVCMGTLVLWPGGCGARARHPEPGAAARHGGLRRARRRRGAGSLVSPPDLA